MGSLFYYVLCELYYPQPFVLVKAHLGSTVQPTEVTIKTIWHLILGMTEMMFPLMPNFRFQISDYSSSHASSRSTTFQTRKT